MGWQIISHTHQINKEKKRKIAPDRLRPHIAISVYQRLLSGLGAVPTVPYQHDRLEMKQTTGSKQNNSLAVWSASLLSPQNLKILS